MDSTPAYTPLDGEMVSWRCSECLKLVSGPDDECCKPKLNCFVEGAEAYIDWFEAGCIDPIPEPPTTLSVRNREDWQTGFDDAMNYQLYGQYETDD